MSASGSTAASTASEPRSEQERIEKERALQQKLRDELCNGRDPDDEPEDGHHWETIRLRA